MIRFHDNLQYAAIPNGSIMDDPTNMFIVGRDPVVLIDPGSLFGLEAALEALDRLGNPRVETILLTHIHVDHGESANELRRMLDAPVRFHLDELPELEHSTHEIILDEPIQHAEVISISGFEFEAILTPGHAAGHISFVERERKFGIVGDLITGWGSSAIFPPFGDLSDYVASMRLIAELEVNPLLPSHGDPVFNGPEALWKFVRRREEREGEILSILENRPLTLESIRDRLYGEVSLDLIGDVTGNVLLHLEKLEREGRVARLPQADVEGSVWSLPEAREPAGRNRTRESMRGGK